MSASASARPGPMREREGVLPNTLALGYAICGYIGGFLLMAAAPWWANVLGVALTAHTMLIAAYLIHEAAHYPLFARAEHNRLAGELMSFVAGSAYASFERIRHLHLRHHRDSADVTCFDYKAFLHRHPLLRGLVYALEWAHLPAVETLMHLQVILRPLLERGQRRYLPRAAAMLGLRVGLLVLVAWFSLKTALLYFVAYALLLAALDFFGAFHHTFDQYFTDAHAPVPAGDRDRDYEQANTYSNVVLVGHPRLNLLTLNFGYHNAHHERASVPWYRLPALHRELFAGSTRELMSVPELMNRLSWPEYRDRTLQGGAPVLLPVGATEQHGPHLPLGTDALLAAAVSEGVAHKVGGIVAPALAYGFKSQPKCGGGQHFTGTTSLDAATLIATVRDTVREFHRHGVHKLVVVNGHYENQWFLIEGIGLAMRELGPDCGLRVMRMEYWDFFTPGTLTKVFPDGFPGYALEHAAVIETSMMLHYHPDLVRLDQIPDHGPAEFPPYDMYPTRTEWVPPSGVLSSARGATREKGGAMAEELTALLARALRTELASNGS